MVAQIQLSHYHHQSSFIFLFFKKKKKPIYESTYYYNKNERDPIIIMRFTRSNNNNNNKNRINDYYYLGKLCLYFVLVILCYQSWSQGRGIYYPITNYDTIILVSDSKNAYNNIQQPDHQETTDEASTPTKIADDAIVVASSSSSKTPPSSLLSSSSSSSKSSSSSSSHQQQQQQQQQFVFPMEFPPGEEFTIPKQYDKLIHPPFQFTNLDYKTNLPIYKELNYTPNLLSDSPYDICFQVVGASTPIFYNMEIHAGVIDHGVIAHSPHVHDEEEILIVLGNEFEELHLKENNNDDRTSSSSYESSRLKAGSFIYYPVGLGTNHTVRNPTLDGTSFFLFKYISQYQNQKQGKTLTTVENNRRRREKNEKIQIYDFGSLGDIPHYDILSFPTLNLEQLVVHYNTFQPGQGYDEHQDTYDIGMLLLQGNSAQITGQLGNVTVSAPAFLYYNANKPHSMQNVGNDNIHLLVFEFQGRAVVN